MTEPNYEWDEAKRQTNLAKHGVNFAAMEAFEWGTAVIDLDDSQEEERWIAKGFIGEVLHLVVYTERGNTIRIISLRKARLRERKSYAKSRQQG